MSIRSLTYASVDEPTVEDTISILRGLKEKFEILKDMHEYISNTLHGSMSEKDIGSMDLMNIQKSSIVSETLQDAYKICIDNYKE